MVAWEKTHFPELLLFSKFSKTYSFKGKVKRDYSRSATRGWTPKRSMDSVHWRKQNSPALLHQDPCAFFHRGINAQRACRHTRTCQAGPCQHWDEGEAAPDRIMSVPLLFWCRAQQHGLFLPLSSFSKWELGSLFNHNYFLFLDHF